MDDAVVGALADQQAELSALLDPLDDEGWARPSRCEGWSVADVVLHVAQTNEMAIASCEGRFDDHLTALLTDTPTPADPTEGAPATGGEPSRSPGAPGAVEDGAGALVAAERGASGAEVGARWQRSADAQAAAFAAVDASARLRWVAGELAARSLCTTRLCETWIHTYDVAFGLGVELAPTNRLWHVARLAWRTLPYAFAGAGRSLDRPVVFELTAPDGSTWTFGPDTAAEATVIRGEAQELCLVAGQRLDAASTSLAGTGPEAEAVLALVRTFA